MKTLTVLLFFISFQLLHSQEDTFFDSFQAIKKSDLVFYDANGISITTESYRYSFSEKNLKKVFRKTKNNFKRVKKFIDTVLSARNYYLINNKNLTKDIVSYNVTYYVENSNEISIFYFGGLKKINTEFCRIFIEKFINNKIPKSIYVSQRIDSIKFLGRNIVLGRNCNWMGVRNVQCPYNGQMSWTTHKTLKEAILDNKTSQLLSENMKPAKKVISKDSVDIIFEGKNTKALKVIYDLKGFNSLLLNATSGAKTLIAYYVAENIRNTYVSCVLSHWDNDTIRKSGLPPLLEETMELK